MAPLDGGGGWGGIRTPAAKSWPSATPKCLSMEGSSIAHGQHCGNQATTYFKTADLPGKTMSVASQWSCGNILGMKSPVPARHNCIGNTSGIVQREFKISLFGKWSSSGGQLSRGSGNIRNPQATLHSPKKLWGS